MRIKTAMFAALACWVLTAVPGVGAEISTRTFGGSDNDMAFAALTVPDGGVLIAGESLSESGSQVTFHLRLLRLASDGAVVWDRTAPDGLQGSASSLLASDDGFIVCGTVESEDGDDADLLLLAVDNDGSTLRWSRYGTELDEHGCAIVRAGDGGFFLIGNSVDPSDIVTNPGAAGYSGYAGRSNIFAVRTDVGGTEIWARRFDSENNVIASGAAATQDGGVLILAYILGFPADDDDILLMKLDREGNEIWSRTWMAGKAAGYDLISTRDGDYLIAGLQSFPKDPQRTKADALLIKVDPDGNELWSTSFGQAATVDTAHVVAETSEGAYVCAGWQNRDLYVSTDHLLLAGIDADGTLLWEDVTPLSVHLTFADILPEADGSYTLVGSASARPGMPFRIWVSNVAR